MKAKAKRKPAVKAAAQQRTRRDKLSRAYLDQENDICDLLDMANITDQLTNAGQKTFAVGHLRDMIDNFKQKWRDQHRASFVGGDEGAAS